MRAASGPACESSMAAEEVSSFSFFTDLFATAVRRSLCRLQLHAVFCEVSVLHAPVQGCSSRTRGKAAGNRGSFVEAGGGKDLAEQGLVAINIGGAGEGKTKETGTEGSGAEKASKADQREVKAAMVAGRNGRGTARARQRARRRTNWEASGLQRPPTSSARTTSRHLCERINSG